MSLLITRPGPLTTVQDLGRTGYQKDGIVVGGALDATALRVANLLVGNAETAAGLEISGPGLRLLFEADAVFALTGAHFSPTLNGQPVGRHRTVGVGAGAELALGAPVAGSRAYLAVAGGLAVAPVLGSRATYLRAGFGGLHGRALRAGDVLPVGESPAAGRQLREWLIPYPPPAAQPAWTAARWTPGPALCPVAVSQPIVRALAGPEYEQFSAASQRAFWRDPFTITTEADRMGCRLRGPALARASAAELLSSAVTFGTVQVPAGGQPIVLLADHQTTGGYPRLAQVISADFSVLAQAVPGQLLRFERVSLAEAQVLYLARERRLQALKRGIDVLLR